MTTDMTPAITPKSDQVNADDFVSGPRTFKIEGVSIKAGQEQPVEIALVGSKPWRPCKSMSRVLVAAWGPDAKQYIGRSVTLYRDPTVKWGGLEVGGIRVSHLSHIDTTMTMALTATKGSRKPFTVKPLATQAEKTDDPAAIEFLTDQLTLCPTLEKLGAEWKRIAPDVKKLTPAGQATVTAAKDARKAELQGASE